MTDTVIDGLASAVQEGVTWMARVLTSWILVPSTDVDFDGSPASQLRTYMLPLTVMIAVAGLIWQGIVMTITRKGEPLLQAIRGIWATALWGAVGVAGTHTALKAGDSYSMWILHEAILKDSASPPDETMSAALAAMLLPARAVAPFVVLIMGMVVLLVALVQTVLMVFREGSIVILAGLLQLAAAGTITRGTSPWLQRVLGWTAAMVAYKPIAATVYATAFMLMSEQEDTGRNFVMGLAVLALAVVAMPVMAKFFSWTTGAMQSSGDGLSMLGAGASAGVHAASSLRGAVGGHSAGDHARYLDTSLGAGRPTASGAAANAPSGAVTSPSARPGNTSGAPDKPTGPPVDGRYTPGKPMPTTTVPAGAGATAPSTTAGAAPSGSAAAAGAGPAAPAVVAGQVAAHAGATAARAAGNATADATQGG